MSCWHSRMLKSNFSLSFAQIGLITLTYQITASMLQPLIGIYTDKNPKPYSLPVGMTFSLAGVLLMSVAPNFGVLLLAAALVGCGSSVFHPESSRVARLASGGRHGLAQSLFQVGGNVGTALGPLLAALVVIPHGQRSIAWFSVAALVAMVVLTVVIGVVLASAFSAILVYAQEMIPGKVGMVAGLFFGVAFGLGGIGAAVLGQLADATSIEYVYKVCSFLPLLGILTVLLPNVEGTPARKA